MPALVALDFDPADLPAGHGKEVVAASLDGLLDLSRRELSGIDPVPAPHRAALERYYGRLVRDEPLARAHLGLPPIARPAADPMMSQLLAAVTAMQQQGEATATELRAFKASQAPRVGPLFSEAADTYHDEMATTRGPHHDELKYVRHRKAVFIAICGDRPVTAYTAADIQHFMNRVRFLPPNQSKQPDYDIANVLDYIAEAEATGTPGLAESTLTNNYVAKVKTIIRAACNAAELPYTLGGRRLKVPKGVPKPKAKFLVDHAAANRLFAAAAGSGLLAETMLPLLGYLTGRRLGLLAFVRGEDIHQHDGVWMVTPRDIVRDDQGNWVTVPFKTGESLTSFVLHDLLVRIGFVDWARRQKGFIFSSLHETKTPRIRRRNACAVSTTRPGSTAKSTKCSTVCGTPRSLAIVTWASQVARPASRSAMNSSTSTMPTAASSCAAANSIPSHTPNSRPRSTSRRSPGSTSIAWRLRGQLWVGRRSVRPSRKRGGGRNWMWVDSDGRQNRECPDRFT